MKRDGNALAFLVGSLILCAAVISGMAVAADNPNPYLGIVERNVFGLKPPTPPASTEPAPPPPVKIILTGITTILGNKRALMKMTPPGKPGEQPKEQYFSLSAGQRDGDLEVLEIDEKAGTVTVKNYGLVSTLDFETNGVKAPAGGAPGGVPPPAGSPQPMRPLPGPPGGGVAMPLPQRQLRLPAPAAAVTPQASQGGLSVTPQAAVNAAGKPSVPGEPPGFNSPEEAAVIMEANRIETQPLVDAGLMPPLPTHPMSDDARAAILGSETTPTPTQTPVQTPVTPPIPPGGAQQFPPQAPQ